LNKSTTNIPSECKIASIGPDDAMILPHDANLDRIKFSERTTGKNSGLGRPGSAVRDIWARSSQIGKYDKPLYLQQTYLL
jgi:hypothetical protein